MSSGLRSSTRPRVRGVLDDLLGQAAWAPPRDWGRPLVTSA
ncbi:MAG TPA: hypothetical protein VFW50_07095 [Streptosporangiaceae bacterium]|nr:hypothetical protein [Streptosporangiaceae bacterium]